MNKIIATSILTLGLLQGANLAHAGFSSKAFKGHYGGTFTGDVFLAQEAEVNPGVFELVVEQDLGTITIKQIGIADGASKYKGFTETNLTVGELGLPLIEKRKDDFKCKYTVSKKDGEVDLWCEEEIEDPFDPRLTDIAEIDLQCALIPPARTAKDGVFAHKKGDLNCVGTIKIPLADPPAAAEKQQAGAFLVANIIGELHNRD